MSLQFFRGSFIYVLGFYLKIRRMWEIVLEHTSSPKRLQHSEAGHRRDRYVGCRRGNPLLVFAKHGPDERNNHEPNELVCHSSTRILDYIVNCMLQDSLCTCRELGMATIQGEDTISSLRYESRRWIPIGSPVSV